MSLLSKPKVSSPTKEQKQVSVAQTVRGNCNSLFNLATKFRDMLATQIDDNPNQLTREEVIAALGSDADNFDAFQKAVDTFISTVENL